MILFYDACAVIYQVEAAHPYYLRLEELASRLRKQHADARVAVSALSLMECRVKPLHAKDEQRLKRFDEFFGLEGLLIVPLDTAVILQATEVRARTSLRTPDAIQAACALSIGDDVTFLTNDPEFRRVAGLRVELL